MSASKFFPPILFGAPITNTHIFQAMFILISNFAHKHLVF